VKRTEIASIGEFGLIERLKNAITIQNETTHKGIGDDAAVLTHQAETTVISTDMLLEGVHFDLAYMPLKHLGYKAMAVNFSDIAAMNAVPSQVLVSIGMSNRFSVEAIEELYEGMRAACEHYKVDLIGGDTTASRSGLVISVTVMGQASKSDLVYRNGAKKGDIICVTGDLGAAYLGLQVLEREKQVFTANANMQPKLDEYEYVVQRQLKPEARTDVIHEFKEKSFVPSAMIDISDGLGSELFHLCTQSELGCVIYEDKLPIDAQSAEVISELQLSIATVIFNGGEDYELLFTVSQEDYKKIDALADISPIGYMSAKSDGLKLVTRAGQTVDIQAQGWKHFS